MSHGIPLESNALLMISCFVLQLEHGFDLTVSRMRMKQQYLNNCHERNQRKKVKKPVITLRKLNYWIIIVYRIYSVQLYLTAIWWLNTHCTWLIIYNASALKQRKWWQMFFLCTVHCLIRWMLVSEIDGFYSWKVHRIFSDLCKDESGFVQVMENLESHGKLKFGLIDYYCRWKGEDNIR